MRAPQAWQAATGLGARLPPPPLLASVATRLGEPLVQATAVGLCSREHGRRSPCFPRAPYRPPQAPNATRQALEIAGATQEQRLFPVACTRFIGIQSCFQ
jgi:hypothetical protein